MIQATGLRIGDAFEYNTSEGWETNIIDVEDIAMCIKDNAYFNEAYRPIPLTEEILLKCGFEKKGSKIIDFYNKSISWNSTFKEISISIQQGNQYVYLREQNDELPNDRLADSIVCIFNGDIHGKLYIHKIQNIIHSLTNTELEINL